MIALALALGCALEGAGDPFPDDPAMLPDEVASCVAGELPERGLQDSQRSVDRSAGGRLSGAAPEIGSAGIPTVVALDYSGSMFGGYERDQPSTGTCGWTRSSRGGRSPNGDFYWSTPGFKGLLEGGVLSGIQPQDPTWAMLFNAAPMVLDGEGGAVVWDQGWPTTPPSAHDNLDTLLTGEDIGGSLPDAPWEARFGPRRMWDSSQMARTLDASAELFQGQERGDGILWIVTDNIIDTGDGAQADEASHNRAFYEKLAADPRWQVVYAWPVSQGDWLCGSTLLVYGLYFSPHERLDPAAYARLHSGSQARLSRPEQVQAFAKVASARSPAPGQPFKLKPDDLDLVEPEFVGTVDCGGAKATGLARTCTAQISLDNQLQHRRVEAATLSLQGQRLDAWDRSQSPPVSVVTAVPLASGTLSAQTSLEAPIEPHQEAVLQVALQVPPIETQMHTLRDRWESAQHPRFGMVGLVDMELTGLRTAMAIDPAQLGEVYGVQSLPQVFENPNTDQLSRTVCVMMTVDNPSYFSSIVLLVLLGGGGLGLVVGTWLLKPTWRHVVVDGVAQGQIRLSRLLPQSIQVDGKAVAKARLDAAGRIKLRAIKPYRVTPRGGAWELRQRDEEFDVRRKLELRARGAKTRARRGNDF